MGELRTEMSRSYCERNSPDRASCERKSRSRSPNTTALNGPYSSAKKQGSKSRDGKFTMNFKLAPLRTA